MRDDDKFYYWNKDEKKEFLGKFFNIKEFSCQCDYEDCIEQKISKELIEKLDKLREACGCPLRITSGYRCGKHQNDLRNRGVNTVVAKKSSHEDGLAADVVCHGRLYGEFLQLADLFFDNVGLGINFLHLDVRPRKADGTKRRWKY